MTTKGQKTTKANNALRNDPQIQSSRKYLKATIWSRFHQRFFACFFRTNVVLAAFSSYVPALSKILYEKFAQKTLVKLTTGDNFTNMLCAHFSYKSALRSFSLVTFWQKKAISYKYRTRKMLIQLTAGVNFTNILQCSFYVKKMTLKSSISFCTFVICARKILVKLTHWLHKKYLRIQKNETHITNF